ncbi:MAG: arylamine N-acetyltransferase [Deltaproteobacteria bacterium]|nr:arylamine N-acetyltransferase [Deltaproteobacteria bacterium]
MPLNAALLDAYFARIGYGGAAARDLATLGAIHRAHILAIPYETLEIQLGRSNVIGEDAFFDKLVRRRRGGWCYEMNGLMTRMFRELGFATTRVGGAVARELIGDAAVGNHMVGLVDLERRYVVDVGLMDGPLEPFPLEARTWREGPLEFRLERLDGAWWRFHNHAHGLARSFDFTEEPRDLAWYEPTCRALQTDAASFFVQLCFASRRTTDGFRALRDATHFDLRDGVMTKRELTTAADYRRELARILGHDLGDELDALWQRIEARVAERARNADAASERA